MRSALGRIPASRVRAVFAGGSVARGDVWAARVAGRTEIYSDIDLYVVVSAAEHTPAVREAFQMASAALPAETDEASFHRGIDIGVYTLEDLVGQPVRPGTVDLASIALLLHGDADVVGALAAGSRSIAPAEALYLLENRAWDVAGDPETGAAGHGRLRSVRRLKALLDIGAAHLIVAGRFETTLAERSRVLEQASPATLGPEIGAAIGAGFRRFTDLSAYLAGDGVDEEPIERWIAEAWCVLAQEMWQYQARPVTLIDRREHRGRLVGNLREFVRLGGALGWSRSRSLVAGIALATRAPRATLRAHAVAHTLARLTPDAAFQDHDEHVYRLTRALGFGAGPLLQRARSAHEAIS